MVVVFFFKKNHTMFLKNPTTIIKIEENIYKQLG